MSTTGPIYWTVTYGVICEPICKPIRIFEHELRSFFLILYRKIGSKLSDHIIY